MSAHFMPFHFTWPGLSILTTLSHSGSQMPVMDGVEATRELTKRHYPAPIVGLSANADDDTRQEAINAGMRELLTKPVSLAELKSAIERYPPSEPLLA